MNKLPKKIIQFKSSDKSHHQQPDMNDLANCCSPVFLYYQWKCKLRENKFIKEPISSQKSAL